MGFFSGRNVNKHRQSGGGNFWTPGTYHVKVAKVELKDGFKGTTYIIEAEVLAVLAAKGAHKVGNAEFAASREVGDKPGQALKCEPGDKVKFEMTMGNIADFLRACFATMTAIESGEIVDPKTINVDDDDVDASYGEEQPVTGLELELYAYGIETAKDKKPFTVIQYRPLEQYRAEKAA